jgi:hypothetical protein
MKKLVLMKKFAHVGTTSRNHTTILVTPLVPHHRDTVARVVRFHNKVLVRCTMPVKR